MFRIREYPVIDVTLIGDPTAYRHEITAEILDTLDVILAGRGVLKIPVGKGSRRYPAGSIASVVDYVGRDTSGAYVELWQGSEGGLYLSDPDDEHGAYPLRFYANGDNSETYFGQDGYNLAEEEVGLDALCYPAPAPTNRSMIHLATYHFRGGNITAGPGILDATQEAKLYIGASTMLELAKPV